MEIFVINLDRRPDRLEFIQQQLQNLNLSFTRISAVDGKQVDEDEIPFDRKKFYLSAKREITPGEIGCAMSHRAIFKRMIDQSIPYALVLEDDVIIHWGLVELLDDKKIFQKFDFLNLSGTQPYPENISEFSSVLKEGVFERPSVFDPKRSLWRRLESRSKGNRWKIFKIYSINEHLIANVCDPCPALASGYIISQHGARQFLKCSEKFFDPIDYVWRYAPGCLSQGYVCPPVAVQEEVQTGSDIKRPGKDKLTTIQKISRKFLKIYRWPRRFDTWRMYGWKKL